MSPFSRGPLSAFRSARITFTFSYKEQYDQAGLVLALRRRTPDGGPATWTTATPPEKWIKTGVEYYHGKPMVSTVACDAWADWSVTPLVSQGRGGWTTVSVVRSGDEKGRSLWVYQVVDRAGEEVMVPLREICWVYGQDDPDIWELSVEAMAARPEKGAAEPLEVQFVDWRIVWSE